VFLILNKFKDISMKINKFKALSVAVCCFIVALWSEAQGMDNQKDMLESSTVNRTANMLSTQDVSPHFIDFGDSASSWASYMTFPVKTTLHMAQTFINMAYHNRYAATLIGVALTCQITAAADYCACMCFSEVGQNGWTQYALVLPNATGCEQWCVEHFPDHHFWNCLPVNKI